ncbi:MAG TPA: hypothetical protein VLH59_12255 [Ignavibacteriaceae bacterium]|nr:hypothetical protein [Ignavibacteriaceae bacterium]
MKLFPLILLLSSAILFSQTEDYKSIQELKSTIKNSDEKFQTASINLSPNHSNEKKSVGLGIVYSLLLPGMGELYADAYNTGKYFTIADGVLWGTLIGMSAYSNWQEDSYKSYAATRAGVIHDNKDEEYYANIGDYTSVYSYNDQKALERNFNEMYDEEVNFWKWNSTDERRTYRDMWNSSETASNNIRFVVGGLILNRIVSAINAARLVSSYNKSLEEEVSWNFSVGFMSQPNLPTGLSLNVQKSF